MKRRSMPVLDFEACSDWPACGCDGECDVHVSSVSAGRVPFAARLFIVVAIAGLAAVALYASL